MNPAVGRFISMDEAIMTLASNAYWLIPKLATHKDILSNVANPKNDTVIYGPTPLNDVSVWKGLKIKIGKISMVKGTRNIYLDTTRSGKEGGRMFGLGNTHGNKAGKGFQWFRMDWHSMQSHNATDLCKVYLSYRNRANSYHFHCPQN